MSVHINSKTFPAEYLSSPEDIRQGMMGRNSLEGCMVFKMGKGHHSFWMKNCKLPLDIVFVLNNRINRIHSNCEVPDSHTMNPPKYTGLVTMLLSFPQVPPMIGESVTKFLCIWGLLRILFDSNLLMVWLNI